MDDTDITALLAAIQKDIDEIERAHPTREILERVERRFLQMLELVKLFLIARRDVYYGYFLMNMTFKVDFCSRVVAGIRLNTFPPMFVSNPLLLCEMSLKEVLYVVCHEVDHVLLNHPAEMVKCNPEHDAQKYTDFNYAADASVNDRLDYEIAHDGAAAFMKRPDGVVTSQVFAQAYGYQYVEPHESYLYYYGLIEGALQKPAPREGEPGQADADGVVTPSTCGEPCDHDWGVGDDPEAATHVVRELVNASFEMMSAETRGLMPEHFTQQVELLNRPAKICWQQLLKKYVGTVVAGERRTRSRLNRRQPTRFDLSGRVDEKTLKIVVAIDTSASVGDREMAQIFNEIFAILARKKYELTVVECDAEVQHVYRARGRADIQPKVEGRGGTAFSPVIEFLNADRYYRDALLIYFTDGYGEREIPRPRTYRNLWVVLGDAGNLSIDEPYGAVVAL